VTATKTAKKRPSPLLTKKPSLTLKTTTPLLAQQPHLCSNLSSPHHYHKPSIRKPSIHNSLLSSFKVTMSCTMNNYHSILDNRQRIGATSPLVIPPPL
jgi:hypothetical protein